MSTENDASGSTVIGLSRPIPFHPRANPRLDTDRNGAYFHLPTALHGVPSGASLHTISDLQSDADAVVPPNEFLGRLRHEKRRADRSKAALSMVLYSVDAAEVGSVAELLDILHGAKRETDILGHVGDGQVAVLCPDTDAAGISAFVRKIDGHAKDLHVKRVAATYPDHLFDFFASGSRVHSEIDSAFLVETEGNVKQTYALKRPLDVIGAIAALCLFAPLMLIVGLAIALTSPGPVIFKQARLGRGGVPFDFYKFRSMRADGDDRIHRDFVARLITGEQQGSANEPNAAKPLFKLKSDPRITLIGRFIRKTSIDELPQLVNVLKGDMSLVGPRPPIPYEAANYQAWHLRRVLTVKPGITGLWQVEGRSKVSFNDMVRMDLRYIRDSSLAMDLKILVKTVLVVLRCEGAA
jgi:lipopolysaccharide/colanic/teichoic acid biosynthesis glycosyltransferase